MYLLSGILFFVLLLFFDHWRRKQIIHKICGMDIQEKCGLLNEMLHPSGYSYILSGDIFTSGADSCQPKTDCLAASDQIFSRSGMVFDTLPVYFNYADKTWRIEFRKGQSGIFTGGGIEICYADRILDKKEYNLSCFRYADTVSMLNLSFSFYEKNSEVAQLSSNCHRLAVFKTGSFFIPSDLSMRISISFPSYEMARSFAEGLVDTEYSCDDVCIDCQTVRFTFGKSVWVRNPLFRLRNKIRQCRNDCLCQIYSFLTRPFCLSVDKVLYLHYYLPFILHKG